jgi:hypothetical protein
MVLAGESTVCRLASRDAWATTTGCRRTSGGHSSARHSPSHLPDDCRERRDFVARLGCESVRPRLAGPAPCALTHLARWRTGRGTLLRESMSTDQIGRIPDITSLPGSMRITLPLMGNSIFPPALTAAR